IELYEKMHSEDPSKGYDKKALEIFERKQGRVFLEEMGKSGARDFAGLPSAVRDNEAELENRMEKALGNIVAERSKGANQQDTSSLQALEVHLQQLRADYRTLEEEIRTRHPDYYALKHPEPASLKDIQEKTLGPDESLLVYGVMKESVCLWAIGRKHFGLYLIKIGENELGQKVHSFREGARSILKDLSALRKSRESIEAGSRAVSLEAQELYELLMPKDAREALSGAKTLYIVPSGPLYGLPFEALVSRMDGGRPRYLVEDYPIAYLSSASLLKTLRETQARKGTRAPFPLLAFANPVYGRSAAPGATRGESTIADIRTRAYLNLMGGTFMELPETEEEAREIKTILMASDSSMSLQLRQAASRSNVLKLNEAQKLADYRYVVFSCHGVVPDVTNQVSQPALVLSQPDPAGGDGFLTMADTFGLRLNADLVTLSACNTGMGKEVTGEGVMGLTRAFMYAGTSAISVTLWSVESISAKRLSTGLYENLQAGKGRAEALRDIKLRMIHGEEDETYRYPFFWAPVVLFGDGR
ncbi:MAG: CHAT domain-containing protein, partial [Syntrophobacteraceae bacterium]